MTQLEFSGFDGATLLPCDNKRIGKQLQAVKDIMCDGQWRTLDEIQGLIQPIVGFATTQSISARLRDLRKKRFGGYAVYRDRLTDTGLFTYRLDIFAKNDRMGKDERFCEWLVRFAKVFGFDITVKEFVAKVHSHFHVEWRDQDQRVNDAERSVTENPASDH